jgi:hypothetical protein
MNQRRGIWFNYRCDPDCGETGWFLLPANTGFGGPLSAALTGHCPKGHQTMILDEDKNRVWISPEQKAPAWYPSE